MDIQELYARLSSRYDVKGWWPHESPWEVMVGALLTQQTAWENAAAVLAELKRRNVLSPEALDRMGLSELESVVRPAGFYRQKASRIKHLANYIVGEYGGDPAGLLSKDLDEARRELLSLSGVGEETADAILLFAGNRPKFVAAVYVSRILTRTGIFGSEDYGEVQKFVESGIAPDPQRYAKLYALLVHHARTVCRSRPRCGSCVLRGECPSAQEDEEHVADHGRE